jgi:L-lactate permease
MDWMAGELQRIERVVIIAGFAFAIVYVLYVFFVKKSFIAMIAALLTAGIFVWGINNIGWFRDKVGDETKKKGTADFGKRPNIPDVPVVNSPGMVVIITRAKDR